MALTVTKNDLLRYIGRKLGYTRTPSSLTGTRLTDATDVLNDALRRFYEPAVVPKHQWSFLFPTARFQFAADQWRYNLPADFQMIHGPIIYQRGQDACWPNIEITSPEKILSRQQQNDSAGRPYLGAVQVKQPDQASETRHELIVYPTSDDDYIVYLRYKINPYSLDSDVALPLGGQVHAQTLLAACLASCADFDEYEGDKYEIRFKEHLASSISHDQQVSAPETLGINYDTSDSTDFYETSYMRPWGGDSLVTYNGSVPSD
jgi:hypothetical protein